MVKMWEDTLWNKEVQNNDTPKKMGHSLVSAIIKLMKTKTRYCSFIYQNDTLSYNVQYQQVVGK